MMSTIEESVGLLPCWHIHENEKLQRSKDKKPFGDFHTEERFKLINRIDNLFIEGVMTRMDRNLIYLNDIRDRYSYLIDFYNRKKVYFTFDRINLYELIELYPNHPNPIRFILKRLNANIGLIPDQAFMIMPFHDIELNDFYLSNIKTFLKEQLGIEIYRADDFRNNDIIVETIYRLIEESEFVIADTTMENKNSFYELGYAAALGKEIITIQNREVEQKLFFDRAHIRTVLYDTKNISGFNFDIKSVIESIKARI